jgi:hypothetical protein
MCEDGELTSRQKAVLDDLFGDESGVLTRHKVEPGAFCEWFGEDAFSTELERRAESANRQAQILLVAYRPKAAEKLINLTGIDKENTARQACLDILGFKGYEYEEKERKRTTVPYSETGKVWATLAKLAKEEIAEQKALRAKKGPMTEKEDNSCSLPEGRKECAETGG